MAAIQTEDEKQVFLKLCRHSKASTSHFEPTEAESLIFFNSEPRRSHPMNHCCPLLDIFSAPLEDHVPQTIVVMHMFRRLWDPPPIVVGEVLECVVQLTEVCLRPACKSHG